MTYLQNLKQSSITRKDIFLVGFITIVGGQTYGWNVAYGRGIQESSVIFCILSLGYFALCFCLAEMSSALPFSGGIYGLARAFIHPLLGSLVATFELLMNVFFIAPCVHLLASVPIDAGIVDEKYLLLFCAIVYMFMTSICVLGGSVFWKSCNVLGVALMVVVLIFFFGSLQDAHLNTEHAKSQFKQDSILDYLPDMASIFLGIQFLPLTSRGAQRPKTDIPLVMVAVMACSIITGLSFMLLAASHGPDLNTLSKDLLPLHYGYSRILSISLDGGKLMNIPFLLGTILGFTFFCGRQMSMMAKSGLLPSFLARETPILETPYASIISICLSSFVLNIVGFFDNSFVAECFSISSLASFLVFISAMLAYLVFYYKYSSLERSFRSPFKTYGAYIGILIFFFIFVCTSIFNFLAVILVIFASAAALIYSFCFSGKVVFSEEEKEEMFKAYLMNGKNLFIQYLFKVTNSVNLANRAAKKRMRKGRNHGGVEKVHSRENHENRSEYNDSENDPSSNDQPRENESGYDLEGGVKHQTVMTRQLLTASSPSEPSEVHDEKERKELAEVMESGGGVNTSNEEEIAPTTSLANAESTVREIISNTVISAGSKKSTISILQYLSSKFNQVSPEGV